MQLAHQAGILIAMRQLPLEAFTIVQNLPQFKRGLVALSETFHPLYLPSNSVIKLNKSTDAKKTNLNNRTRLYSKEDDKFIIEQVKLHGYTITTFKKTAKALGRKFPYAVKLHYDEYIVKQYEVTGFFSPEEDQKIIEHVKIYGQDKESFEDIANLLGRPIVSVRTRHKQLISKNEFEVNAKVKTWELHEDKLLIDHVFNIKEIKAGDTSIIINMKQSEFTVVATELKRSSNSCRLRWMQYIAPTLKTHLMKLPMTNDWKKDVLLHIVNNNIKHKKEMDIDQILKEVAPGQTSLSMITYLDNLKREQVNGVRKQSKSPLRDLASKRFKEQDPKNPLFNENHKGEQKRLEWCQDIISYYKTLI